MGDLPPERVNIPSRPIENTGVDYAGPFYYKEGLRRATKYIKCYMAMFVCLATKAVHIEISADLSTETFLNVLKRFISRRGRPANMYSDNATNFVGAENELTELREMFNNENSVRKIINSLSAENIQWHFIPSRAPHHGGLWEAAVKSAKRHLHKVLENASVRYDELVTFTVQVEAVLNSRPLTVISADANDPSPLTPGHFLIGDSMTSYPEPSLETLPINR